MPTRAQITRHPHDGVSQSETVIPTTANQARRKVRTSTLTTASLLISFTDGPSEDLVPIPESSWFAFPFGSHERVTTGIDFALGLAPIC